MYLFWQKSKLGNLHISEDAVKRLFEGFFPEGYSVREVSLWEERNLLVLRLCFPSMETPVSTEYLERLARDARAFLEPAGFTEIEVVWVEGERVPVDEKDWRKHLQNPLTWGVIVSVLVMVLHLGGRGVFWTLVLGALGYGVAWVLLTPRGAKTLEKFLKTIKG